MKKNKQKTVVRAVHESLKSTLYTNCLYEFSLQSAAAGTVYIYSVVVKDLPFEDKDLRSKDKNLEVQGLVNWSLRILKDNSTVLQ